MDKTKKVYRIIPSLKDTVWGGNKLLKYGKVTDKDRIAESWELSFTKGGEAKIESGETLNEAFPKATWGRACRDFAHFPTLTKFIDARDNLSLQVHPSDEYALKNEGQYGKSEMWYIVSAEKGSGIYIGLKDECDKERFRRSAEDGTLESYLSFKEVKEGDVFFINSGTVHAICKGVLLYEIQQNSTLTYRLYDYNRRDKFGNLRELHLDKAMDVVNLKPWQPQPRDEKTPHIIGKCSYFETSKFNFENEELKFNVDDTSYLAITCIKGECQIENEKMKMGDTFFSPCGVGEITLKSTGACEVIAVKTPLK